MQRKWGSESFWGKCLRNVRLTKKHWFSESNAGCNGRWEDNGSTYILPSSSHGSLTVVYI